jgi:hypothetical protein
MKTEWRARTPNFSTTIGAVFVQEESSKFRSYQINKIKMKQIQRRGKSWHEGMI